MSNKSKKLIIEGKTESGQPFRPSDWAERMSGNLSTVRNQRVQYSHLLQPISRDGTACIQIDTSLAETNPLLYKDIMDFAAANNLRICGSDEKDKK